MRALFTLIFLSFYSLGFSQTQEEILKQFQEERKQMMKQMMKIFQDDFGKDSFFDDDFDPFKGARKSKFSGGENVEISEDVKDNGDIHILITPKNKNLNLDIQTSADAITIKSEMKVEEKNNEGGNSFSSFSSSSYTQTIGIPHGYKVKSSNAEGKGFKIILSADKNMKPAKSNGGVKLKNKIDDKMPLEKSDGEEII